MLLRKSGIWGSLAVAGLLVSGSAGAVIEGSAHDFTGTGSLQYTGAATMCATCHTPHAGGSNADAPLWDHALTGNTVWTAYSGTGGSMQATAGDPSGVSLLCMSCHDGSISIDNYGGTDGGTTIGAGLRGTDLSNDHPIGFTYDTTLAGNDGGLHDPATTPAAMDLLFGVTAAGGEVQCASCHDVHNGLAGAGNLGTGLPRVAFADLCQTCHNK